MNGQLSNLLLAASPVANPINITPVGVAIALAFVAAISGVLIWMVRVPPSTAATARVARAVRQVTHLSQILVPTHGGELSDRTLSLACAIARRQGATLEVLYVQEVPRFFPMDAKLAEEDAKASEALDRAVRIAERFGIKPLTHVVRAREAGPAIVREAEDVAADLIMIGSGPPPRPRLAGLGPAADYVFRYATCEVILTRAAFEEAGSPWSDALYAPPRHAIE